MEISIKDGSVEGRGGPIGIRDYIPETVTASSAFLWVHGGGFTSGGLDQKESDAPARRLAAGGRWVRTLDYRLAPRVSLFGELELDPNPNRFPAGHNDVLDVAADLRSRFGGPISIGGGSAGANLAAGAALEMRDTGAPMPRTLVLGYGVFHAVLPDRRDVESDLRGPLAKWAFNPKMTRKMNLNYVGDESLLAPGYAFPGGADLRALPPTILLNSSNDRLRRSGDAFADELRSAGVDVDHEVITSTHAFFNAPKGAAFERAIRRVTDWLDTHD